MSEGLESHNSVSESNNNAKEVLTSLFDQMPGLPALPPAQVAKCSGMSGAIFGGFVTTVKTKVIPEYQGFMVDSKSQEQNALITSLSGTQNPA